MAETGTLTIRVPREYLARLNALATKTRRSKSSLAGEALAAYLGLQEWQVAVISEALDAADAGTPPMEHEPVARWLESWGSENELPRPS